MIDDLTKVLLKVTERDEGIPGYLGTPDAGGSWPESVVYDDDDDWSTTIVNKEKARVLADLRAITEHEGERAGLDWILKNIGRHERGGSSLDRLRSFLYAVTALRHNAEHGGLTRVQVQQIATLAESLLKAQGVSSTSSKLGFLYGDLGLARAHAQRKRGALWSSLLEQQAAHFAGKRAPSGGLGFQALAAALRVLRMGHAGMAVEGLIASEQQELTLAHLELARVSRVTALRLAGERVNARDLLASTRRLGNLSVEAELELDWEAACLAGAEAEDYSQLFSMTLRGKAHYQPTYLLEAHLWARAADRSPRQASTQGRDDQEAGRDDPAQALAARLFA